MVVATFAYEVGASERIQVSIPGGFSWSLRLEEKLINQSEIRSFNPWRVFLVVATGDRVSAIGAHRSFNPWRVFLVVATMSKGWIERFCKVVSIPGGFSWSLRRNMSLSVSHVLFMVSIPGGFSWSLRQLEMFLRPKSKGVVSIPGGFSWSLRRHGNPPQITSTFPSFNPWRVFLVVATELSETAFSQDRPVSIPGGFSWSLRRKFCIIYGSTGKSFNPWRVFLVVATESIGKTF